MKFFIFSGKQILAGVFAEAPRSGGLRSQLHYKLRARRQTSHQYCHLFARRATFLHAACQKATGVRHEVLDMS